MMTWVVTTMAVALAAAGVGLVALWRRVQKLESTGVRVDRMGEAVTLLSETAEAGFAAVAQEIEKLQRGPAGRTTASRATVSRRVVKAAGRGDSVEQIARREALSEGEVRLHLALAEAAPLVRKTGGRRAVVRA
ncbi:MAG: hypothetical protein AMXMBFR57_33250 [Acidimicrobiia bacterium]|jgi:DNA-binding NarL/FixJ family response regulator